MGTLILVPLALTLILCLCACFFIFTRKSLAQSLCVQSGVRLQKTLSDSMQGLMSLNPKAAALRRQREKADRAVQAAYRIGDPRAIAAAKAVQLGVILAQTRLQAEQQRWLSRAEGERTRAERELRSRLLALPASRLSVSRFFPLGLAVRPAQVSLSPDYEPARPFETLQQQRVRFDVDLTPPFVPAGWNIRGWRQPVECSVSLKQEEKSWPVQILAASAPSN